MPGNIPQEQVPPAFIRLAERLGIERPVICDIGSRDAREGILLFERLGGSQLHVFEPNPAAAAVCRRNLGLLHGGENSDVAVFNEVAVAEAVGTAPFYPVNTELSENKDIGFSSLYRINPRYTRRRGRLVQDEVMVKTVTLDSYFAGRQHPDILWLDVEGAELRVLEGARSVLRSVKLIHVEVSFRAMQVGKPLFWDIHGFLERFDFKLWGFMEVNALKGFLYRHRLLPNAPWRLNAVYYRP